MKDGLATSGWRCMELAKALAKVSFGAPAEHRLLSRPIPNPTLVFFHADRSILVLVQGAVALGGLVWARRKDEGLPPVPPSVTPWQRIYRETVTQLSEGATIKGADAFQRIGNTLPRHNRARAARR